MFIFVETEIFKRLFPAGGEMAGATRHEKKMKKLRINTMTKDEEWREREREREARLGNCACSTSLEEHGPAICLRNEPSILLRTGGGGRGCNESKRNGCWKFRCGAERRRRRRGENRDEKFQSYPRNLFRYSSVFTILIFDSR